MKRRYTDNELLIVSKAIDLVDNICGENAFCQDCILENRLCQSPDIKAQLEILLYEMKKRNKEMEQGRL